HTGLYAVVAGAWFGRGLTSNTGHGSYRRYARRDVGGHADRAGHVLHRGKSRRAMQQKEVSRGCAKAGGGQGMNLAAKLSGVFALLLIAGCAVGPNYKRPEVNPPEG